MTRIKNEGRWFPIRAIRSALRRSCHFRQDFRRGEIGQGNGGKGMKFPMRYSFALSANDPWSAQSLDATKRLKLEWQSAPGCSYQLQSSTDLITWADFLDPRTGTGGVLS